MVVFNTSVLHSVEDETLEEMDYNARYKTKTKAQFINDAQSKITR